MTRRQGSPFARRKSTFWRLSRRSDRIAGTMQNESRGRSETKAGLALVQALGHLMGHKTRIMYIESDAAGLNGPARIGLREVEEFSDFFSSFSPATRTRTQHQT